MAELNDKNRAINEEQFFPNPAYVAIHTYTREIEPTYDYANLPSQSTPDCSEQAQDVVNQEQVNDMCTCNCHYMNQLV